MIYIIIYIFGHFDTENYAWRLPIVQNLCEFWQFFLSDFLSQNVLIFPSPKIHQGAKCPNTHNWYTTSFISVKGASFSKKCIFHRQNWDSVEGSAQLILQQHNELIIYWKPCLNLCFPKWLKPSQNHINLRPLELRIN